MDTAEGGEQGEGGQHICCGCQEAQSVKGGGRSEPVMRQNT